MDRRLYRSESDQMLSGVSGGLAEYFDIDPVIVRLLWVILAIFSAGLVIVVYVAFWIVMPTYSSIYGDEPEEPQVARGGEPETPEEDEDKDESPSADESNSGGAPDRPSEAKAEPAVVAPARRSRRRTTMRVGRRRMRRGQAGVVIGAALVIGGGIMLLNNFLPFYDPWRLWPLILVGIGLAILAGRLSNGR